MVSVGETAPSVRVKQSTDNKTNEELELTQIYENQRINVFYFFPAVFTGVCTSSSCQLRDDIQEFSELNTNIYGISVDMPFSQNIFRINNQINYPLLSDWNKYMINAFDIVDNNFAGGLTGVAKRSLFAVKEGKIIYKWIAESPGKYPPFDELKEVLRNQ